MITSVLYLGCSAWNSILEWTLLLCRQSKYLTHGIFSFFHSLPLISSYEINFIVCLSFYVKYFSLSIIFHSRALRTSAKMSSTLRSAGICKGKNIRQWNLSINWHLEKTWYLQLHILKRSGPSAKEKGKINDTFLHNWESFHFDIKRRHNSASRQAPR